MRRPALPVRHALIGVLAALSALPFAHAGAADWSSLAPSAHPRSEGTFVVHEGGAFHLNGFDANIRVQNSVERYDIAADTWETVAETTGSPGFRTARTHNGTVVVDGEMWLIGGRVGGPSPVTDRIVIFDLDTYAWRDGPTLPLPFASGGAALLDRRIHVFGGVDPNMRCDVDTHLVYDLDAPAEGWRDLSGDAPFPSPRNHFGTAVMDGRIYVVGGQIGHDDCGALARQREQTPLVHVYDPITGDWDRLADLPWSQSHAEPSTFVHAGRLWSVGGMVNGDRVLSYDAGADAWTWRDDLELPNALLAPGARIFHGNRLHVFGGGVPNVLDPRTATWVRDVPGLESGAPSADGTGADTGGEDPVEVAEEVAEEATGQDGNRPPEGDVAITPDGDPADAPEDTAPDGEPLDTSGGDAVAPPVDGPFDLVADDDGPTADREPASDDTPGAPGTGAGGSGGGVALWLAALLVLRVGTRIATRAS